MKFKKLTFIFLIVTFSNLSSFAFQPTDWNIEHLRGKVKSIEEDTAVMKLKKGVLKVGSRSRSRSMTFDEKGRKTYEWVKIENLSPFETFYTYEKQNRYNRGVRSNLPVSNRVYETLTKSVFDFKADENALYEELFAQQKAYPDKKLKSFKYNFDKDGRLIKETMYSADGEPVFLTIYVFGKEKSSDRGISRIGRERRKTVIRKIYIRA